MPENAPDIGAQVEAHIAENHSDMRFKQVQLIKRVAVAEVWQADQIAANVAALATKPKSDGRSPDGRFAPAPVQAPVAPVGVTTASAPVRGNVQGIPTRITEMDEATIRSMTPDQVMAGIREMEIGSATGPGVVGANMLREAARLAREKRGK
jgi:hypothetical protein